MGDILAFPSRCTGLANQNQCSGTQNASADADDFSVLINTQSRIIKALLFSVVSLETALAALANTVNNLPAGDCRERLLKQQTAIVVMIYQAKRMLAEYEPSRNSQAIAGSKLHNSVHELD